MVIVTGTVRQGSIEVPGRELPDGTTVTVLAAEGDETFELGPADEAKLLAAMQEADGGSFIPASELIAELRRS